MKIVVCGGLGFIGTHLSRRLYKEEHDVVIIDDCSSGKLRESVKDILDHCEFIQASLSLYDVEYNARKRLESADIIYNLASIIGSAHIHNNSFQTFTANLDICRNIIENSDCPIVFSSSVEVQQNGISFFDCDTAITEEDAVAWINASSDRWSYAFSKFACENLFHYGAQARTAIARLSNVYGTDTTQAYVIPKFIKTLSANPESMQVRSPDDTRHFTYIHDTVEGLICIGDYLTGNANRFSNIPTFNIGYRFPTSIWTIAHTIKTLLNAQTRLEPEETTISEKRNISFDRAKDILGFDAETPFIVGIRSILEDEHLIDDSNYISLVSV